MFWCSPMAITLRTCGQWRGTHEQVCNVTTVSSRAGGTHSAGAEREHCQLSRTAVCGGEHLRPALRVQASRGWPAAARGRARHLPGPANRRCGLLSALHVHVDVHVRAHTNQGCAEFSEFWNMCEISAAAFFCCCKTRKFHTYSIGWSSIGRRAGRGRAPRRCTGVWH